MRGCSAELAPFRRAGPSAALLAVALVVSGCDAGGASRDDAEAVVEQAIVAACTRLVHDYAVFRDRPDPAAYAATFAVDGELVLPSGTFRGRDALERRLAEDGARTRSRHEMSTVRFDVESSTRASGVSYATIYVEPVSANGTVPATAAPFAIGEYRDTCVLTERGWKFSRREFITHYAVDGSWP